MSQRPSHRSPSSRLPRRCGHDRATGPPTASRQGGRGVHRRDHPGSRGPDGGPQAAEHVRRVDGLARAPSARMGGRRQQHRRGDGRRRVTNRRHDPRRWKRRGRRRRPRHPHRPPRIGQECSRGRAHRPSCGRQVRGRRLQGVWRPPRSGRQRGQCAFLRHACGGAARKQALGAGIRPRRSTIRRPSDGRSEGGQSRAGPSLAAHQRHTHGLPARSGDL